MGLWVGDGDEVVEDSLDGSAGADVGSDEGDEGEVCSAGGSDEEDGEDSEVGVTTCSLTGSSACADC